MKFVKVPAIRSPFQDLDIFPQRRSGCATLRGMQANCSYTEAQMPVQQKHSSPVIVDNYSILFSQLHCCLNCQHTVEGSAAPDIQSATFRQLPPFMALTASNSRRHAQQLTQRQKSGLKCQICIEEAYEQQGTQPK